MVLLIETYAETSQLGQATFESVILFGDDVLKPEYFTKCRSLYLMYRDIFIVKRIRKIELFLSLA